MAKAGSTTKRPALITRHRWCRMGKCSGGSTDKVMYKPRKLIYPREGEVATVNKSIEWKKSTPTLKGAAIIVHTDNTDVALAFTRGAVDAVEQGRETHEVSILIFQGIAVQLRPTNPPDWLLI